MSMFKCELIKTKKNSSLRIVQERFYRQGESYQEVLESLEMFEWPEGTWRIEEV